MVTMPEVELWELLRHNMDWLDDPTELYDSGHHSEAKRLAVIARTLCHDTPDRRHCSVMWEPTAIPAARDFRAFQTKTLATGLPAVIVKDRRGGRRGVVHDETLLARPRLPSNDFSETPAG